MLKGRKSKKNKGKIKEFMNSSPVNKVLVYISIIMLFTIMILLITKSYSGQKQSSQPVLDDTSNAVQEQMIKQVNENPELIPTASPDLKGLTPEQNNLINGEQ